MLRKREQTLEMSLWKAIAKHDTHDCNMKGLARLVEADRATNVVAKLQEQLSSVAIRAEELRQ